jgi:diguanylate cyclase (GGDEF)-like protein
MIEQRKSRLSLRQVLTIPYVVLVLALALTIVGLSYRAGSQAVDTVSSHLLRETVGRIGQAIDRHIVGSGAVLEAAFPDGMPVSASIERDVAALRARFWIATSLHMDPNNYVYFGNRLGQGIGLYRPSRTEGELRIKLKAEEPRAFYRFTGVDGVLTLKSHESKLFDPRTRPWYKAGENESAHTWTSIYIDFVTEDLVATRARRVLGPKGEFQGVVATDVSLRTLNDFVSNLKVSSHGLALIVEPNGNLIASSVGANVKAGADGVKARVSAAQSGNPLVAAIYSEIQQRLSQGGQGGRGGQVGLLPGANTFNFTGPDGNVIHAGFDRIKDDAGLEWITAVAMPRSDFMSGVSDNVMRTAVLSALAALAAIAIGLRILNMLAVDLKHLSNAALQVGEGQLNWQVGIKRPDEIGQLAKSFEIMQLRLQTDELTSLANREAFMQRLRFKIGQAGKSPDAGRFAVLFIDLNRFKQINDTFGHGVGDRVLIEVGRRLKGAVRSQDLVARLSGDEFVVLLDRVNDREGLERVRVQIHLALKEPLAALAGLAPLNNDVASDFDFGGSVGDALFPDDGVDAESLLKKADRRMYGQKFEASEGGKANPNRRFSDSMMSEFRD